MSFLSKSVLILMVTAIAGQSFARSVDYFKAFGQDDLYIKYADVMEAWGCTQNVFKDGKATAIALNKNTQKNLRQRQKEFKQACLHRLATEHKSAIFAPAASSITIMGLQLGGAGIATKLLGKESYGGSVSVFASIFNSMWQLKDVLDCCYDYWYPAPNQLTRYEKIFAQHKCFIPKALWPAIIEKFIIARYNTMEERRCIEFIEFALGLTRCKKITPVEKGNQISYGHAERIMFTLYQRIDNFFEGYQQKTDNQYVRLIKINVGKFILALLGLSDQMPRYLYLYGPGGIGKTHFVRMLYSWIEELLPNKVLFENLIILSQEELEGSYRNPGAMLRTLRNQLAAKKQGAIIFMDEATWLNNPNMISGAKRVFNGSQADISTTYFGDGMDGMGIKIKGLPTIIFVASNEPINDPALASRFDVIEYPQPNNEALVNYARQLIQNSHVLRSINVPSLEFIAEQISKFGITNFRQIEANAEQMILAMN